MSPVGGRLPHVLADRAGQTGVSGLTEPQMGPAGAQTPGPPSMAGGQTRGGLAQPPEDLQTEAGETIPGTDLVTRQTEDRDVQWRDIREIEVAARDAAMVTPGHETEDVTGPSLEEPRLGRRGAA